MKALSEKAGGASTWLRTALERAKGGGRGGNPTNAACATHDSVIRKRAFRALAALVAAALLLVLACVAETCRENASGGDRAVLSAQADAGMFESVQAYRSSLPSWFSRELFLPGNVSESYANEAQTVLGFVSSEPACDAFERICTEMEAKGWLASKGEGSAGLFATFTREEGFGRWALVSCFSVGSMTSVVVQVRM